MPQFVSPRLASELMRRTETHTYTDVGYYIPAPTTLDDYGQPATAGTETLIDCSFTDKPKMETWRGDADIQEVEAEVRFTTPEPDKGGKFRLTERFRQTVTERTFEIISIQDRGAFGYVCALKAVTI